MYKFLIRPILFLIPPEIIHKLLVISVKTFFAVPGIESFVRRIFTYRSENLKTVIAGLQFENKVGLAAGFDKNADFFKEFSAFGFSFIEIGTVTPVPQDGNPKPRLFRVQKDNAMINRMGFNNKGVAHAVKKLTQRINSRNEGLIIGGNIGKNTLTSNENAANDYLYCFREMYDAVNYFVVNVSCPNIADLHELQHIDSLRCILEKLISERKSRSAFKPVFVKISPDLTFEQIDEILDLCIQSGTDGIVATNTTIQRYNLTCPKKKIERMGMGGLSGSPLKDRSTEIIRHIHNRTHGKMPVIGVGGIMSPADAIEKIKAGAWLLQIYTGFIFEGPWLARKINKAVEHYLQEQKGSH
jgi:dihydroorotate dehydrogenase